MDVEHIETEGTPGFVVIDVPYLLHPPTFMGQTKRPPTRVLLPLLTVRTADDSVLVPEETLEWSIHLAGKGAPSTTIRRRLNSAGRLFEYSETVVGEEVSRPGMMDLIVWEYLRTRLENPVDPAEREFEHWHPVQYDVVRTEFRDLVDFGRFCATYSGPTSPVGAAFKAGSEIWTKANRSFPAQDLLSHLAAQRARWHVLRGRDGPAPPPSLKRVKAKMGRKKSSNETTLCKDQVDCIIDREKNEVFKALWIELAYQGPRVSETLNQWRCDILDSSYAPILFNAPVDGPLVVYADPRESRFTGSLDAKASILNREQVLKKRWGLVPRPDTTIPGQRAGDKGMSIFNAELRISHGTWLCKDRAAEFGELIQEIMDMHSAIATEAMHPYLYINTKNAAYRGEPLQIGNLEEAFERACVRAGIQPHIPGAHPHGLRHFYKSYAKEGGASEEEIQRMMRHRNPSSQRVYGKHASDGNRAMSKIRKNNKEAVS